MKAVVAGGSGFVGQYLCSELEREGFDVVVLARKPKTNGKFREVMWDGVTLGSWVTELDGSSVVVNLSGSPIEKRWTPEYKREILASRVQTTRAIGEAVLSLKRRPKVWINSSAVGWYGDRGGEILAESSRRGSGFLADVCEAWERACLDVSLPDVKQVCVRTGLALGRDGGLFPPMARLAKLGMGGAVAGGLQWMPLIHIKDLARFYVWCISHGQDGSINACCPEPVQNTDFMRALRTSFGRPFSPPVPPFAIRLGSGIVGKEGELLLMSQRAVPTLAMSQGFTFEYSCMEQMLDDLINE